MNILHLLSNRKWTERAEPAVDLALAQRALGHEVLFACGRWTLPEGSERSVGVRAREKGLNPIILELPKHFSLRAIRRDVPRLRKLIREHRIEVVHVHMENAHLLAALALRGQAPRPRLVVQSYEAKGPAPGFRTGVLMRHHQDGLITISRTAADAAAQRFQLEPARVAVIEPGVDLNLFRPCERKPHDGFTVGMVTRIRKDRRPELPVQALALLRERCPGLRVLLVGRGEAADEVRALAEREGLRDRVRMPGYLRGEDLLTAYQEMDALVYPTPGTDQSCRTVREAMALGLPVAAGKVGFLTELIEDGLTGRFFDLTPPGLADLLETWARAPESAATLGRAAEKAARHRFSLDRQALQTVAFCASLQPNTEY